jgi:hypothetical protein
MNRLVIWLCEQPLGRWFDWIGVPPVEDEA